MSKEFGSGAYGDDHPLIGVPCLYEGLPAIPYGSYEVEFTPGRPKQRLLVIQHVLPRKGRKSIVTATSGIRGKDLIPVDRHTLQGRKIYHEILAGLANNDDD